MVNIVDKYMMYVYDVYCRYVLNYFEALWAIKANFDQQQ